MLKILEEIMEGMNTGMITDIVCLSIIAIFGITNMAKGFFKQIFKVVCVLGALVLAYFFCDEAAAKKLKLKKYYAWRSATKLGL